MTTIAALVRKFGQAELGLVDRIVLEPGELHLVGAASAGIKTTELVVRKGQVEVMPSDHRHNVLAMQGNSFQASKPFVVTAISRTELVIRHLAH